MEYQRRRADRRKNMPDVSLRQEVEHLPDHSRTRRHAFVARAPCDEGGVSQPTRTDDSKGLARTPTLSDPFSSPLKTLRTDARGVVVAPRVAWAPVDDDQRSNPLRISR